MDDIEKIAREICGQQGLAFLGAAGSGAFKQTYAVTGPLGPCALKLIVGPIDPQRITREIDALRACDHPSICKLYAVGTITVADKIVVFLLEEFLAGGSLSEKVKGGLLGHRQGAAFGEQLSDALGHFAERQIVHRDIKPDNIMLRTDGTPVLVDLGLMRNLDKSSLTQTWLARGPGTPAFAPPEQLRNEKAMIDWRSDQFSLGVTLSLSILGMHPYTGTSQFDNVVETVGERRPHAAAFLDATAAANLGVLRTMTAAWPIHRFAKPAQLIEAWRGSGRT